MIQINMTLIVQVVNFFITYKFLSVFLFKPVINRILLRKQDEARLREEIALKTQDVDNFMQEKTTQLAQFQKDAKTDYSFILVKPPRIEFLDEKQENLMLDDEHCKQLKKEIVKRILDVN